MDFKDFEEKTIDRREIYNGKIIKVALDRVELPQNLGTSYRELVFHPGAVAVVPITKDNKIILVKQYRKAMEKVTLEIPAGKIEQDEKADLLSAIRREMEEEIQYKAEHFTKLTQVYTSPGFCDELVHIYLAKDLEKVENPRCLDDDEVIEIFELTLEEAKAKQEEGLICDAKTVMGLMYWELELLKNGALQ